MASEITGKRVAISKANAQMVGIIAGAAFVTIFCLFAAKAVWSQNGYQARVITAKTSARNQLKENLENFNNLADHYNAFNATSTNVLGGVPTGSGDKDGTNAKIILDALPYVYDYPALASSVEKITSSVGLKISSITGVDDQLNQGVFGSPTPKEVSMPITFEVSGASYEGVKALITKLEQSIRPFQIDSIDISGGQTNMTATITAHTYYQAAKTVSLGKKVVK